MKKLYLAGLALALTAGASAQELKKSSAPQRAILESDGIDVIESRLSPSQVKINRGGTKAPGDILFEYDFDGDLDGWTNDDANRPASVSALYEFIWDTTAVTLGSFDIDLLSPTFDNGFAHFPVQEQDVDSLAGFANNPTWAGLRSPSLDFSQVSNEDLENVVMSFYNNYTHCCNLNHEMRVDVSTDGGATFPLTNRGWVVGGPNGAGNGRNLISANDNQNIINIGQFILPAADKSNVVVRLTWDSEFGDANGQFSDRYYWAIDDIVIKVAESTDMEIVAGSNGLPREEFDYFQIPMGFLKDYPLEARVTNNGSQDSKFTITSEFVNEDLGLTKTYTSQEFVCRAFTVDTTYTYEVFTDYAQQGWVGTWSHRVWINVSDENPDASTDGRDTTGANPLFVNENVWSHAAPWNRVQGDVAFARIDRNDDTIAAPHIQFFTLPPNVDSATISGVGMGYHDDLDGFAIGVPNFVTISVNETIEGTIAEYDSDGDYAFLREDLDEFGTAEVLESNRDVRLTQAEDDLPDYITGLLEDRITLSTDITFRRLDPNTGELNLYLLKGTPTEPIHILTRGRNSDNSVVVRGDLGGGGDTWYGTGGDELDFYFSVEEVFVNGENVNSIKESAEANLNFSLEQNIPNPFSDITEIAYNLKETGDVSLTVMNIAGKTVVEIPAEKQAPGRHTFTLGADALNSGIYFYTLTVDGNSVTKKMVVNK